MYQQMKKRPGTSDHAIILNVMVNNEYNLPDDMKNWVVIDIGAHIGAFAMACVERGASQVISFEPEKENFDLLIQNIDEKKVWAHCRAVWSNAHDDILISGFPVFAHSKEVNTGGSYIYLKRKDQDHVVSTKATTLKAITQGVEIFGKLQLVKLDCEYSEWDILYSSSEDTIRQSPRYVGEFHEDPNHPRWENCNEQGLINFFQARGFTVRTQRHGETNLGMFWAERS